MDLAEPCIDANDDGECSVGLPVRGDEPYAEAFRDTNNDGVWSEGNDDWDKDTEIWRGDPCSLDRITAISSGVQSSLNAMRRNNAIATQPVNSVVFPVLSEMRTHTFWDLADALAFRRDLTTRTAIVLTLTVRETFIEINGTFDETRGAMTQSFVGDCFLDALPTQPQAPTHRYEFVDNSGPMVEEAQFSTIRLGVRYRTLNGAQREDVLTFHTCR